MVTRMPKRRRRYSRRRGLGVVATRKRRRLTLTVAAVTIVVGGFAAIVIVQLAPAEQTYQGSLDSTFAASLGPIARESNYTGSELISMLGHGRGRLDVASFVATLDAMIGNSDQAIAQFETLTPPGGIARASSSCLSSLRERADALTSLRATVADVLDDTATVETGNDSATTGSASETEASMGQIDSTLLAADQMWSTCRHRLLEAPGRQHNLVPASSWVGHSDVWRPATVDQFAETLIGAASSSTNGTLVIAAVSGDPPAVVTVDGADVIPVTTTLSLHIVVENSGSVAEADVVTTASLKPMGSTGQPGSSRATASIGAGQSYSFHPAPLRVVAGATYTVTVTVTGPGQAVPATRIYRITVDSPGGLPG